MALSSRCEIWTRKSHWPFTRRTDQARPHLCLRINSPISLSSRQSAVERSILGDASTGLITPGAVTLADLNNNGVLDLIVANSGSNNVLVYPGEGNGQFGPALNGGHGFFTGTNPVGITVADVNGDGRPDLIVANKGSNDVSILINEKVGDGFTFVPGPRLERRRRAGGHGGC